LFYWFNEITNGDKTNDFPELKCLIEYVRPDSMPVSQNYKIGFNEVEYSPGLRGEKLYESSSIFLTKISTE